MRACAHRREFERSIDPSTAGSQGVTFIGNSTSIQSLFTRINTQFSAMASRH